MIPVKRLIGAIDPKSNFCNSISGCYAALGNAQSTWNLRRVLLGHGQRAWSSLSPEAEEAFGFSMAVTTAL